MASANKKLPKEVQKTIDLGEQAAVDAGITELEVGTITPHLTLAEAT